MKRKKPMDRINLNTINQLPDDLREILEQAPEEWWVVALYEYLKRNVSIEQIRRDWEQYKATQDANE